MDFDFKITAWERVNVNEEDEGKVLQAIKDGIIKSSNDLYDFLGYQTKGIHCHKIDDTEEPMTLESNNGYTTIDVIDDEGDSIWQNGN